MSFALVSCVFIDGLEGAMATVANYAGNVMALIKCW